MISWTNPSETLKTFQEPDDLKYLPKTDDVMDKPTVHFRKPDDVKENNKDPIKQFFNAIETLKKFQEPDDATVSSSLDLPKPDDATQSHSEDFPKTDEATGSPSEDFPETDDAANMPSLDPLKTDDATDNPLVDTPKTNDAKDSPSVDLLTTDDASPPEDLPKTDDASPQEDLLKTDDATGSPSEDFPETDDAADMPSLDPLKTDDATDNPLVDTPKTNDAKDSPSVDLLTTDEATGSPSEDFPETDDATDMPSLDPLKTDDATDNPLVDTPKTNDAKDSPSVDLLTTDDATGSPSVDFPKTGDASPPEDLPKPDDASPQEDPLKTDEAKDSPSGYATKTDGATDSPLENPPKTGDVKDNCQEPIKQLCNSIKTLKKFQGPDDLKYLPKTDDVMDKPTVNFRKPDDVKENYKDLIKQLFNAIETLKTFQEPDYVTVSSSLDLPKPDDATQSHSEDFPKTDEATGSPSEDFPKTDDAADMPSLDPLKTDDATDNPLVDTPKTNDAKDSPSVHLLTTDFASPPEDLPKTDDASPQEDLLKTDDATGSPSEDFPETDDAADMPSLDPLKTDNATDNPLVDTPKTNDAKDSPSVDLLTTDDATGSPSVDFPKTGDASPPEDLPKTDNASPQEDLLKTDDATGSPSEDFPKTGDASPPEDLPKTDAAKDMPSIDPLKTDDTTDNPLMDTPKTNEAKDSPSVDLLTTDDATASPSVDFPKTGDASPPEDLPKTGDASPQQDLLITDNATGSPSEDFPKTDDTTDNPLGDTPKTNEAKDSPSVDLLTTDDATGSPSVDFPKTGDASPPEDLPKTGDASPQEDLPKPDDASPQEDPLKTDEAKDSPLGYATKTDGATDSPLENPPKTGDVKDNCQEPIKQLCNSIKTLKKFQGPDDLKYLPKTDDVMDKPTLHFRKPDDVKENYKDPIKQLFNAIETSKKFQEPDDTTVSSSLDLPKPDDATQSHSEDFPKTDEATGSPSEDFPKTDDAADMPSLDPLKKDDAMDNPLVDTPKTNDAKDSPSVDLLKTDEATGSPSEDFPETDDTADMPSLDPLKTDDATDNPLVDTAKTNEAKDSPSVDLLTTDDATGSRSVDFPKTGHASPPEDLPKTGDASPPEDLPKTGDASPQEDLPQPDDASPQEDPLTTDEAKDSPSGYATKTDGTTDSPLENPPKTGDVKDNCQEPIKQLCNSIKTLKKFQGPDDASPLKDLPKTGDVTVSSFLDLPKPENSTYSPSENPPKTDYAMNGPQQYLPKTDDATDNPSANLQKGDNVMKSSSRKHQEKPVAQPKEVRHYHAKGSVSHVLSGELAQNITGSEIAENSDNIRSQPWMSSAKDVKDGQKLSAEQLMDRLRLEGKHQKLKAKDFLQLTEYSKSHEFCVEEEIAQSFLKKLLTLDYTVRCIKLRENTEQNDSQQICDKSSTRDAFDDIFGEAAESADETNRLETIDLMDAQMAVFHCADSFLKQLMVTKLSQCQFALPLLVPNPFTQQIEFPLWTFRQIKKSWKTTDDKGQTQPVYRAETPMVAFFRFGSVSSSKSQLINSLINEKHDTFFHRNCPGSSRTRILMDGVVEIAWYCPSGEKTDTFPQCVAFCNLHGDAGVNEKQLDIITQMSSVNVVILPQMNKNNHGMATIQNLYQASKPLICLLTENNSALTEMCQGKYRMGLRDRNQSVVFEELRKAINKGFSSLESSSLFKLEDVAKHLNITVDEKTDEDCKRGKDAAQQMMSLLKNNDLTEIKELFLPCQGKLWHQWCQKNKELHRPTLGELHKGENIEKNKSDKKLEMLKIREQQQTSGVSEFIQIFTHQLNSQEEIEMMYFLKWLGILLDDFSTESVSALYRDYDKKWSEVLDLKKKHDKSQQMKAEQELGRISEKLQAATFGLEHILREVGQIYESCSTVKNNKKNLKIDFRTLPGLAAKMMMSGFPLELMDGDAAHVPLIWVTAVLDELIQKLGDKRVFVLSVLGIQSSGKSTMLNAMFGLQFAVSAGRCTRGAFMQLVKVSEEMKMRKQLEFDYILVVDTEGLRALELAGKSTRYHDNELATFVVGLGNMTLINVFGENTAEMQDTLQTIVQAFLRMKKIKLNPSCMFVHQNVSDVTAGEKNMEGRRRQQKNLDEMTKVVAKEEDCNTEFFSDVIAFDVQNDVKYFSQLWEGSPPMAPPNPNYSRNIQELKDTILLKASTASSITLSQFKIRINDLWNALLSENFVFSFKNTLEISVYRKLESKYIDWTFSVRSAMLRIEDKFYNRIANGNIEIQDNDLLAEIKTTKDEVEKSMKFYFDEDKDKDILCQWRGRFETQMKGLNDDLVKETKRKLNKAIEQKKARENLDKRRTENENTLFTRSKECAVSLKSKGGDERVLKKEFNTLWSKWVTEMTEDIPPLKDFDLWDDVTQVLSENHEPTFVNQRLNLQVFKQIVIRGVYDDYIILQRHQEQSDRTVSSQHNIHNAEYNDSVRQLIHNIVQETKKIMEKLPVRKHGYNVSYIQAITDCVQKSVQQHELENQKYKLKREFITDLCLYVCDIGSKKILKLLKKFRESNDPKVYHKKQKTQYYNVYMNCSRGETNAKVLIDLFCSKLEPSILQEVYNKTAIDLAAQMRSDIRALRENRSNLEKHILKSLAEKEDFHQYMQYIHIPKQHFKQFVKTEVDKYFTEQSETIVNIFKGNLKQKEQIVSNAVHAVTEEVKNKRGDGNMWLRSFTKTLTNELKFKGELCVNLTEVKDLDFLKNHLSKTLNEMMIKLQNSFTSIHDIKMEKCRKTPDEILIDHFCQCCWVQCPFCKAICTNSMENHSGDHSAPFHRSVGLNGHFYKEKSSLANCFCTTEVVSDNWFHSNDSDEKIFWKEYRKGGPELVNWSITPDLSELPYWKWVVCRFQKDLEKHYSKTFQEYGEIPDEWRQYTKEDAIESLDKYI